MKQHEIDAQIAALTKQIEELKAMPVEPEQPLCVMPGRMASGEWYWLVDSTGFLISDRDDDRIADGLRSKCGHYFSSKRQASADAHAVSVMRLMRRQPGVVGADDPCFKWRPSVRRGYVRIEEWADCDCGDCMFPCYATESQARAAIEAVGGEDALRRCAEYWSGLIK